MINEKNERLELKPLETSFFYNKMQKIEPTKKNPIRSYIPKLIKKKSIIYEGMKYKPGFVEQYKVVKNYITNNNIKHILANIDDAIKVLKIIESVIKKAQK
jgi:hypothetical protein